MTDTRYTLPDLEDRADSEPAKRQQNARRILDYHAQGMTIPEAIHQFIEDYREEDENDL